MRFWQICPILALSFFAAACSTTVETRQSVQPELAANFQYIEVMVDRGQSSMTMEQSAHLKSSVTERLTKLPQGVTPVRLQLTVKEFNIRGGAERFWIGVLAGANKMTVAVKVVDNAGTPIADFDVERSANPGVTGAFYDQTTATIDSVADGVAQALSSKT